ncbi:hypothetical protein SEEH4316_12402, partial [Salmonella enterica subsp. enterica serovar Heidelberg str. RI-11-014316]
YDAQYLNLRSFRHDGRFVIGIEPAGGDHFIEYPKILEDFLRSRLNTFTAGTGKRRRLSQSGEMRPRDAPVRWLK